LVYRFEDFTLDKERHELWRGNELIAVEPQVLDLLRFLIENRERVVSKDDLIAHVWNGRIVSESTLTSRITAARHAVGDSGEEQRLIRTIARKGLRFVGEVIETAGRAGAAPGLMTDTPASEAWHEAAPRLPDKPSIAVLPFTNMSGDPEQEYFSDGITEDIISALSRLRWFFVIARNSTFVYKGHAVDVKQVGRDLGVRYVLEGSVRKSGQRLRISAQLIDAMSGNHIWVERYDREVMDIFALQDEITTSVIAAIEPRLVAAEALRAESRSTADLDAWDLVARALSHYWRLAAGENEKAISMLRQAVERYPDYAPAHSMLAFALLVSGHMGWVITEQDREYAARLAHRARELDDRDPWAYLALGYLAFTSRLTDEAVRMFRTALELNPNADEAIRMSPRDPSNSFFYSSRAAASYMAGRFDQAVTEIRRALEERPDIMSGHRMLVASLAQSGRVEEAKEALKTLRSLQPSISIEWIRQWVPYTERTMERFLEGMRRAGLE
jgi:TolB-like protein